MGILDLFSKKKEPENYETVLESLRLSISARQSRLAEIRQRERRSSLWVTLYLLLAWVVYAALWYTGWIGALFGIRNEFGQDGDGMVKKGMMMAPVFVGPVGIMFTRRIVQLWYTRIGNAEEETLKKLLLEQRSKVEELKKKTDFYSTQKLLERYDRPETSLATPAKKPVGPRQSGMGPGVGPRGSMGAPGMMGPGLQGTPDSNLNVTPKAGMMPPGINGTPMPPGFMSAWSPQPLQPTPKRWYDRLADVVLGEEEGAGGASSKYALICKRCFTHNGLVMERDYETTQFVCMKCGFLNPAPKPSKLSSIDDSPTTITSPLTPLPHKRSSSPISPSPPNPPPSSSSSSHNLLVALANATKAREKGADVGSAESGDEVPPVKGQKPRLTQRRSTRNSRKSGVEGHDMDLD